MCGIAGWIGQDGDTATALKRMAHRGKDGSHIVKLKSGQIGHNLHAIVSEVAQPLSYQDKWFVGNLELYNWQELAAKNGMTAENDAEIAFKLLLKDGMDVRHDWDGPYAFAYCDGSKIWLARDKQGVFPLFFRQDPFAFASERKAFPELRELNPRHIIAFDTSVHSLFEPAEFESAELNEQEAIIKLDELLKNSVEKRIAGQTSLLLSGGIDSALLAYYLKELGADFTGVVVGLENSADIQSAKQIADHLGIKLNIHEFTKPQVLSQTELVTKTIESSDPVKLETALVVYMAAKNIETKTALAGFGADELFGGYSRMHRSAEKETSWALRNIYERSCYFANTAGLLGGTEIRTPYLDKQLVKFAMSLPAELRQDKLLLKKLAEQKLGELGKRAKKAAQYGSRFSKVLPMPKSAYLKQFWPNNRKLAALVSGGKDSWFSLWTMKRLNYPIACAIVMQPAEQSWMFQIPGTDTAPDLLKKAGIPVIVKKTDGEKEKELADLEKAVEQAVIEYKVEGLVSGAVSSEYQRDRIETVAEKYGLSSYNPLWGINQKSYLDRLIREKFRFRIVSVAADGLDDSWLGKEIGPAEVKQLIELAEKYKFNPAGEGGEYETQMLEVPPGIEGI
ncbi:MAG: diphthine--ammonia ligase [Candidatus Altiarchaeota archaeon]|nr:diphthine--ammonia ligase [Candidatus Altiarchaeota archaeon]